MGCMPVAASAVSISAALASRFKRSILRMTLTSWAFQRTSMPRPAVRPIAAASLGDALLNVRAGWNFLNAPHFAREQRKP